MRAYCPHCHRYFGKCNVECNKPRRVEISPKRRAICYCERCFKKLVPSFTILATLTDRLHCPLLSEKTREKLPVYILKWCLTWGLEWKKNMY